MDNLFAFNQSYPDPVIGFVEERVHTRGYVDLLITFGTSKAQQPYLFNKYWLTLIHLTPSSSIAKPSIKLGVIVSTPHMTMKFPQDNGTIITVKANPKTTRKCYAWSLKVSPCFVKTSVITANDEKIKSLKEHDDGNNLDSENDHHSDK